MTIGYLACITVFVTATLSGCGNEFADKLETPTVIEIDLSSGDIPTDAAGQETQESAMAEVQDEFWRKQYETVLQDWTVIEDYDDFSYLPMYFGEDYAFDSYWLCDVDQNGIPELFLHSSTMECITAAFTCTEENLVHLAYDDFYGINLKTGELVVHGHWHGAGGSWENEWKAYKVLSDRIAYAMDIDFFDLSEYGEGDRYTVYDLKTEEYVRSSDGTKYWELYAIHVEPCITVDHYTLYDISDLGGLDRIQ